MDMLSHRISEGELLAEKLNSPVKLMRKKMSDSNVLALVSSESFSNPTA